MEPGKTIAEWQMIYDTLRYFVETCPRNPFASHAFVEIGTALYHLDDKTNSDALRASYLEWLKSVFYLNTTDPEFFCQCVDQMSGTLPLPHDTKAGHVSRATNITLSVLQWLIQNTACDTPSIRERYTSARRTQLEQWENNKDAYVLDTTLPPSAAMAFSWRACSGSRLASTQ